MVEDTEKPRRPAKPSAEQKPMGSRGNAQNAGRRDEARPAARSNSSDRPRGDRPAGRPQGEGRPRGDRPQGAPGTGPRGPRPQGSAPAGARPAYGRPAPKQFEDKSDETAGLELTDAGDDVPATKVAHVPKKTDANYSMSYRGSSQKAPSRPNAQNKKNNSSGKSSKAATQRQSMLNTHKLAPFKSDMNEILSRTPRITPRPSSTTATSEKRSTTRSAS